MAPAKKPQKMSLGDFLGNQTLGSWADEMEDMPVASESRTGYGQERRAFSSTAGFGGDRNFGGPSDRGYAVREQLPLPSKPPYTAHLGNLSFDATEVDVQDFFSGCSVTSVRIVEDKMDRKPKGFGYVEFGSLDGLKRALELNGSQFQGRNIRISVAEPPKDRPDRPEARELNDWTRKGPLPDLPQNQRRVSERGGFRNYETASDAGSDRGDRRRPPPFEGDGKIRDFSNWERKGPLSPVPAAGSMRDGGRVRSHDGLREARERKLSPSWGEGRSQEGSRPPRGEFRDRPQNQRQPTEAELDNQWRSKMRPDAPARSPIPTPDTSTPSSPAAPAAPAVRPRLNLQKRTVSEAEPAPASASSSSDARSSPFGAARPIDTAARDKEIEEKRQLALRLKKEQDEKAREEKRAKEAAAKAEKPTPTPQENGKSGTQGEAKENGAGTPAPGRSYEILRRTSTGDGEAEEDAVDGPANGNIVEDKAVKPKEVVRDPPKAQEGSWRQKPSTSAEPAANAGPTAEGLEEEGWSTVPSKPKGNRRNNAPRAIAS